MPVVSGKGIVADVYERDFLLCLLFRFVFFCSVFCVCHLLPAVIGRGSVANVCEGEFGRSRQSSVEELHSAKRGQQEGGRGVTMKRRW